MREIKISNFNLYTTIKDLRKNILFILLAVWFGFSASRMYCNYFKTRVYTSEMTIAVNHNGLTSTTTSTRIKGAIDLSEKVAALLRDRTVFNIISEKSGTRITSSVNARHVANTNFIHVTSTSYNPQTSYKDLLTVLNNQEEITQEAFTGLTFGVVDNPHLVVDHFDDTSDLMLQVEYSVLAGLLAVLIIVVISYFRDTVKNESDIENMVDSEVFGVVYEEKIPKKNKDKCLLSAYSTTSYLFNHSFKKMAAKLESLKRTSNISSILITSVFESEGKTTISTNLACALAAEGNRVAVVDVDFKCPSVYKRFKSVSETNEHDIARYIKCELSFEDVVQYDKESNVYIYCNSKGYKNSFENLRMDVFKEFISRLEAEYDFVILDSSPCGLVADSEIISEMASTVLLVVAQDYTEVDAINEAVENIGEERILGCVFNKVGEFKSKLKEKMLSFD